MVEICSLREKEFCGFMPREVKEVIENILEILDLEYGAERDKFKDAGGYVIIVEKKEDFEKIKEIAYIDCEVVIAEYVDKIICNDGKVYANALILCNNDYAISLIIPMELVPQNLKNYIIE